MIRLLVAVVLALALGGCKGSDAKIPIDPFYGQTKIPPPGTGQISRRPANDPYYPYHAATNPQGAQPATTGLAASAPRAVPEASATRAVETKTAPASQLASRRSGDLVEIPLTARRSAPSNEAKTAAGSPAASIAANSHPRPAVAASSAAAPTVSPAGPARIVQTIAPRAEDPARQPPAVYSPPGRAGSGAAGTSSASVDIMDLPPVGSGAKVRRDDWVQLASAVVPASHVAAGPASGGDQGVAAARKKPDLLGNFGYSTDYRRLRGRLEYLEKEQRWKLRYIPVDGVTDQYGGSVIFEECGPLAGFHRGDFVEVRGELAERSTQGKDFAPAYRITEVNALGS